MNLIKKLINQDLKTIGRAADMLWLGFGNEIEVVNYKNQKIKKDEYALHIQCPWRFLLNSKIFLGNNDFYELINKDENNDWDEYGNNIFDKITNDTIIPMLPLKLNEFSINEIGDLKLIFANGLSLVIFINSSLQVENWRFIDTISGEHTVFHDCD